MTLGKLIDGALHAAESKLKTCNSCFAPLNHAINFSLSVLPVCTSVFIFCFSADENDTVKHPVTNQSTT